MKEKVDRLDFIKMINFYSVKDTTIKRAKRKTMGKEKIFAKHV